MTLDEFLNALTRLPQSQWYAYFLKPTMGIRLAHYGDKDDHCPITAVAYDVSENFWQPSDYLEAAFEIRLPEEMANSIVEACDVRSETHQTLRQRILSALNMQEVA